MTHIGIGLEAVAIADDRLAVGDLLLLQTIVTPCPLQSRPCNVYQISTAAGRTRNCPLRTRPLRRRGRRISKVSKTCAAFEDRRKLQRCRVITRRVDHPASPMAVESRQAIKSPQSTDLAVMRASLRCLC